MLRGFVNEIDQALPRETQARSSYWPVRLDCPWPSGVKRATMNRAAQERGRRLESTYKTLYIECRMKRRFP